MARRKRRANLWAGVYAGLFGTDGERDADSTDAQAGDR